MVIKTFALVRFSRALRRILFFFAEVEGGGGGTFFGLRTPYIHNSRAAARVLLLFFLQRFIGNYLYNKKPISTMYSKERPIAPLRGVIQQRLKREGYSSFGGTRTAALRGKQSRRE